MNAAARKICKAHVGRKCTVCPLRQACAPRNNDSPEAYELRVNAAADKLEGETK